MKRKEKLQKIIPESGSRILYLLHLDGTGIELFEAVCKMDLAGIVAKRKDVTYDSDGQETSWIKIKNPRYSQVKGRQDLFVSSH